MASRLFVLILSAAMVASLFLPWTPNAATARVVPWDLLTGLNPEVRAQPSVLLVAYIVSFALAALLVILCLVRSDHKLIAAATGALPLGIFAYLVFIAPDQIATLGLPLTLPASLNQLIGQSLNMFGLGVFLYLGSATLLFIVSIFDPGPTGYRRKY